jgi:uncharacterized Zn-finger protein
MGPPSYVSHTLVFLRTIFPFLANILHSLFPQLSPSGRLTHRPIQAQVGGTNAPIAIVVRLIVPFFLTTHCPLAFARAFNLKTHMDTHNPERAKPFICPHSSCKRSFSRKHDLQRHRTAIHRDQSSSSSVYSDSSRISKPAIGVTAGTRAWCDKCGKGHVGREGGCECNDVK